MLSSFHLRVVEVFLSILLLLSSMGGSLTTESGGGPPPFWTSCSLWKWRWPGLAVGVTSSTTDSSLDLVVPLKLWWWPLSSSSLSSRKLGYLHMQKNKMRPRMMRIEIPPPIQATKTTSFSVFICVVVVAPTSQLRQVWWWSKYSIFHIDHYWFWVEGKASINTLSWVILA